MDYYADKYIREFTKFANFFTFTVLTIYTVSYELMKLQFVSRTSGETCRSAVLVVEPVAFL